LPEDSDLCLNCMSKKSTVNQVRYSDGTGAMQLKSTSLWEETLQSQVYLTPYGQVVVGRYDI
jgi:hypothetical protein